MPQHQLALQPAQCQASPTHLAPFPRLPGRLQIETSNKFQIGWLGLLAGLTLTLGPGAMLNLYFMPYWFFVMWLDAVTYLHHHGPSDENEQVPWYRGEVSCSSSTLGTLRGRAVAAP